MVVSKHCTSRDSTTSGSLSCCSVNQALNAVSLSIPRALATAGAAEADLYPGLVLTGNIAVNASTAASTVNAGFIRVGFDLPMDVDDPRNCQDGDRVELVMDGVMSLETTLAF